MRPSSKLHNGRKSEKVNIDRSRLEDKRKAGYQTMSTENCLLGHAYHSAIFRAQSPLQICHRPMFKKNFKGAVMTTFLLAAKKVRGQQGNALILLHITFFRYIFCTINSTHLYLLASFTSGKNVKMTLPLKVFYNTTRLPGVMSEN